MVSEVEVARPVRAWLESEGWETFAEVRYEGRVADIVAVRGPETWIVEVKKNRAAKLLDQARKWIGQANCIWLAARKPQRDPAEWWDTDLHLYGLGEFTIDAEGEVDIRCSPARYRLTDLGIRSALKDAHKTFAEAGNAKSERWSPFQETARMLLRAAELNPGFELTDMITSDYKAASIKIHIQQGHIKGLVVRSGKVYLEGFDRHRFKQQPTTGDPHE